MPGLAEVHTVEVPQPELQWVPRAHWIGLGFGYLVLGGAAFLVGPYVGADGWWVHGLWCVLGLMMALPTLMIPLRCDFAVTLTDHRLAFLTGFSVFLLFGASYLAVGPEDGVDRVMRHYPITVNQALRVDALNGVGFGLALLVSVVARGRWLGGMSARVARHVARIPVTTIILVTFIVGAIATVYRLIVTWSVQPAMLSGLWVVGGQLLLMTILLLASHRGRGEHRLRWCAAVLAILLAVIGGLQFMKQSVLEPLLALIAGLAIRFGARKVLPLGLAAVVSIFVVLGDVVTQGRRAGGFSADQITLAERWQYMVEGWNQSRELFDDERYSSWSRLAQVHTEAAGVALHDAGEGSNGEPALYWVLVPRFVAPDKPAFVIGASLYEKITGRPDSSDAIGLFTSGYYYAGWWGFLVASVLSGWVVAQTSAIARAIHDARAMAMLPFSLLGLFITLGAGNDFLSAFLGTFMYIAYPLVVAGTLLGSRSRAGGPS
jgi:hypothetical protein